MLNEIFNVFSTGAAVGPLIAGLVNGYGWQWVFYVLMLSDIFALVVSFYSLCVKHDLY